MRFLIVDDHPLLRDGVAALLQQMAAQVQVLHAATAADGLAQALAQADAQPPLSAALVDLRLGGSDGVALVAQLHDQCPELPVVVLSSSEEPGDVRRALAAGARGYCPKSAAHHTLLAAMRLVLAGELYVPPLMLAAGWSPGTAAAADRPLAVPSLPGGLQRLTDRQREVLRLLCEGRPNKDISRLLGLSEKTTKAHVTAIFKTLGVVNRTQAVLVAQEAGLGAGQRG